MWGLVNMSHQKERKTKIWGISEILSCLTEGKKETELQMSECVTHTALGQ